MQVPNLIAPSNIAERLASLQPFILVLTGIPIPNPKVDLLGIFWLLDAIWSSML